MDANQSKSHRRPGLVGCLPNTPTKAPHHPPRPEHKHRNRRVQDAFRRKDGVAVAGGHAVEGFDHAQGPQHGKTATIACGVCGQPTRSKYGACGCVVQDQLADHAYGPVIPAQAGILLEWVRRCRRIVTAAALPRRCPPARA